MAAPPWQLAFVPIGGDLSFQDAAPVQSASGQLQNGIGEKD
jgi:hypothetical protein